jgi:hypothetical protein
MTFELCDVELVVKVVQVQSKEFCADAKHGSEEFCALALCENTERTQLSFSSPIRVYSWFLSEGPLP